MSFSRPIIFGILNVTPDSFSDGGKYDSLDTAIARAEQMINEGADVVDVGGESTRPGALPVSTEEERSRIEPVIREINKRFPDTPISIDTMKSQVAQAALDAGATIVNDVSALKADSQMGSVCARANAKVILMHSRWTGDMRDMASYDNAVYGKDIVQDIVNELNERVNGALSAGIKKEHIIIDPGLGFAKKSEHSMLVVNNASRLADMGFPVLIGASRKRFVSEIAKETGATVDTVTAAINCIAYKQGATMFRVHAVSESRTALDELWRASQ